MPVVASALSFAGHALLDLTARAASHLCPHRHYSLDHPSLRGAVSLLDAALDLEEET